MKALLYARYSTTMQSSLSIDDQLRVCAELAERQGWTVAGQHCDAAISGAVRDRPGLNALIAEIERGDGDVIVAESLDRISRDQEDIAAIFKRALYARARIWTASEGEVGELHIGLRGTMAAMTRKDTADKVKRGLTGRALAGMNPGGMAYGYRKVPKLDERGEPVRGLRVIDEDEADVIRRIFDDYIGGVSARAIVARLNAAGVKSPSGGLWRISTVNGDAKRKNGILHNELYRGRLIYNRTHRVYHPVTRRREIRVNPPEQWTIVEAPDLRIVTEQQWLAAEAIRSSFVGKRADQRRRPKRLLSGKAFCGVCGNAWRLVSGTNRYGGRWGCAAHHDGRGCSNGRTVTSNAFERRVLCGLQERMLDPELVDVYVEEYRRTYAEKSAQEGKERRRLERRFADADKRVTRFLDAYADGRLDLDDIADMLTSAKAEREKARRELEELAAEKIVALHPGLASQYRRNVATLVNALDEEDTVAARNSIRALIDRIVVTPAADKKGVELEVHGLLATILALASGDALECPVMVVPLERLGCNRTLVKIAA